MKKGNNNIGVTIGKQTFYNTSKNNIVFSTIMFCITILCLLHQEWVSFTVCLIILIGFILDYFSDIKKIFVFKKKGISIHTLKPLYVTLPIFRDIEVKYEDIFSIDLKYPGGGPILFLALGLFFGTEDIMASENIRLFSFLLAIFVCVLPFLIRRRNYCIMVIELNNGEKIESAPVKASKKTIIHTLEKEFKELKIENILLPIIP